MFIFHRLTQKFLLLASLLIAMLLGCHSSNPEPAPSQYSVPAEVEPYMKSFRAEAAKRNRAVSTDNLIITFQAGQQEDICGQCYLETGKPPRITLNNNSFCWQEANQQEREGLIFHELGHCLLMRLHKADRFPNGAYVTLMNPDNVGVYAPCRYPIGGEECDKRNRREYYIDELFDSFTPVPAWGK